MKSILDPTFKYQDSAHTDIAKTFARVRREMKERAEAEAMEKAKAAQAHVVIDLKRKP